MQQLELIFPTGLLVQFPDFYDCVRASVQDCGKAFKNISADLDMSSTRLHRMLNPDDGGVHFPIYRLPELISATGDMRPVHWLVENFCQDKESKRQQALDQLPAVMTKIQGLLEAAAPNGEAEK